MYPPGYYQTANDLMVTHTSGQIHVPKSYHRVIGGLVITGGTHCLFDSIYLLYIHMYI